MTRDRLDRLFLYVLGAAVVSAWLFVFWAFYMENVR